jgi:hypothetical protein
MAIMFLIYPLYAISRTTLLPLGSGPAEVS